jgi:hypothetical protein
MRMEKKDFFNSSIACMAAKASRAWFAELPFTAWCWQVAAAITVQNAKNSFTITI